MKECILSLSNFYVMDQDYQVLRNINLKLKSGETLAILGQDGSGTSAFINGLTGKSLALGQLFYKSKLVDFTLNNLRRHKIEIITDKPKLMENMSVSENLFLGTSRQKNLPIFYSNKKIAKISEIILEKYNLNLNPRTKVKELTLEEKKNLAFVRAFSCGANVVILYEPSENISLTSLRNLHSMIKRHKSEGKSVIYITKQWEDALRIADRIAILNEGEITEILSSDEVKNNPKKLIDKIIGVNLNDNSSDFNDNQLIDSVFEAVEYLTSEYELNDLLNLLAENTAKATRADACEISLIDEETSTLIDKSIYKSNKSIEFISNEAEILKLIDEERVYYFTKRDKGFERFFRLNNDICSLICVPFYIRSRLSGIIQIYYKDYHLYTEEEIKYL
jgi:ABC-type sugar transport system ATPase subunit